MATTITLDDELEKNFVEMCESELDWKICGSGCPDEYETEITTMIKMLRLLGYNVMADDWEKVWKEEEL